MYKYVSDLYNFCKRQSGSAGDLQSLQAGNTQQRQKDAWPFDLLNLWQSHSQENKNHKNLGSAFSEKSIFLPYYFSLVTEREIQSPQPQHVNVAHAQSTRGYIPRCELPKVLASPFPQASRTGTPHLVAGFGARVSKAQHRHIFISTTAGHPVPMVLFENIIVSLVQVSKYSKRKALFSYHGTHEGKGIGSLYCC